MLVKSGQISSSSKLPRGLLVVAYLLPIALILEVIGFSRSFVQSSQPARAASAFPDPPRVSVNTDYPAASGTAASGTAASGNAASGNLSGGKRIQVPKGGDLQQALNAARPGSTIVLEAGATFVGNFR